eukprot:TRINITY_DN6800_c0_g1_i1.p1 TRINITY_DN6800_c0_g1~~TRINITY_DN6800_c0_g1_i1.p1  ORF type:complete len:239 (+),score=58.67 TRINITY_DN6800_c0_g1_i1:47-718(+)
MPISADRMPADHASPPGAADDSAAEQGPPQGTAVKAVFIDFDSTISVAAKVDGGRRHAVADNREVFARMTQEEIVANFGGEQRLQLLRQWLSDLRDAGVARYIISIGFRCAFQPHLELCGLLQYFPDGGDGFIFGQDSPELRRTRYKKAPLIAEIMARKGWHPNEAIFMDDSSGHIELCQEMRVCRCLHVRTRGMSRKHMQAVLDACMHAPQGAPADEAGCAG